jgi:hypothetical protein
MESGQKALKSPVLHQSDTQSNSTLMLLQPFSDIAAFRLIAHVRSNQWSVISSLAPGIFIHFSSPSLVLAVSLDDTLYVSLSLFVEYMTRPFKYGEISHLHRFPIVLNCRTHIYSPYVIIAGP